MSVPDAALQLQILKLPLQPIVENAIFLGIMPAHGSGRIAIHAAFRRGMLIFYIRDDGIGIDSEMLRKVLSERIRPASKERFTGIGLPNVHNKLRLHYPQNLCHAGAPNRSPYTRRQLLGDISDNCFKYYVPEETRVPLKQLWQGGAAGSSAYAT
jgi:LytS/YehU family sensor histidine kinase